MPTPVTRPLHDRYTTVTLLRVLVATAHTPVDAPMKPAPLPLPHRYVDPSMEEVTTMRSRPLGAFLFEISHPALWPLPITSISEGQIIELVGTDGDDLAPDLGRVQQQTLTRVAVSRASNHWPAGGASRHRARPLVAPGETGEIGEIGETGETGEATGASTPFRVGNV